MIVLEKLAAAQARLHHIAVAGEAGVTGWCQIRWRCSAGHRVMGADDWLQGQSSTDRPPLLRRSQTCESSMSHPEQRLANHVARRSRFIGWNYIYQGSCRATHNAGWRTQFERRRATWRVASAGSAQRL